MKTANVHEAKTTLSKLLDAAAAGETVFITRNGIHFELVERRVPPERAAMFGSMAGQFDLGPEFDEADEEIAEMFYG